MAISTWNIVVSCSNGLSPNGTADSISVLARKGEFKDIKNFRARLLSNYDLNFRKKVYSIYRDSTQSIRAMALYVTHNSEEIAEEIFAECDVDVSHTIFGILTQIGDSATASELKVAITKCFNAMDLEEKARWITSTLPPSAIAQYLDSGDSTLVRCIMALYNSSDKAEFVSSLNEQTTK